jgi:bacillithiol biosynthesis cysteine-adding enzyme BshC
LFEGEVLCITTGQQPGLITGPLFTVYKALTAIALARSCAKALGRDVVPVFWVAGDDHDFAEANHYYSLTLTNTVERVVLRERSLDGPSMPLYRERLGPDIDAVMTAVVAHSSETEFRPAVLEWLTRHYEPTHDLASAFAGALAELLGSQGLVVFRPTHVAAKTAMAPLLLDVLAAARAVDTGLQDRAAELQRTGRDAPVPVGSGATPVLIEARLGRDRLVIDGERFVARRSAESWTLSEIGTLTREEPERLSPNVLLRPVVEAALFPTLAYVAGPGELAYFPQCDPLYRQLDVEPQATVARWSGRVIETRVAKVLDKYGVAVDDLATPEGHLAAALVKDDMPQDASESLAALRRAVGQEYQRLRDAAATIDPTLKKSVQSAQNTTLSAINDIERRLITHLKKRNETVVQQIAKARANLFPLGRPQERTFTVVPYLIRYGNGFLDTIMDAVPAALPQVESSPRTS